MSETIEKCEVIYTNDKYILEEHDYDIQYYPYYKSRLDLIKPFVTESVAQKWGPNVDVLSLRQLAERSECKDSDSSERVVIMGILFKRSLLQPSILKELSEENPVLGQPVDDKFTADDDTLWLQSGDETIEILAMDVHNHCTGICVALKGFEDDRRSAFVAEEVCYANNWIESTPIERVLTVKDQYIALVSGLGFSKFMKENKKLTKGLNVLVDIMTGRSEFAKSKSICRLIIAGNGIGIDARKQETDSPIEQKLPVWNQKVRAQTLRAIALFDKFMARLGQSIEMDVMPGSLDPTSQLLPQQPLHPCIFKEAFEMASIKCVSNPHSAQYNGVKVLATSGQNIDSIREFTQMNDSIEIMRKTMEWLHIAPTTPDTLLSYPFKDTDPFILREYPDVYVVGNQQEFNTGTYEAPNGKQVLLVSVPIFEQKLICVLLNLRSLKCDIIALN